MSALGSSTSGAARVIETLRTSTRWLRFAAIAVLLAGAVAGCSSGAAVSPSTGASSAPTSAAAPQLLPGAGHTPVAIPAGTYAVVVNGTTIPAPMPVIRVPAGYNGAGFAVNRGFEGDAVAPDARGLSFWEVQSVMSDPCKAGKHGVDPGPTVADLARALAAQPLRAGSDPVPVTVAGYQGLYVETSVPAHIDFSHLPGRLLRQLDRHGRSRALRAWTRAARQSLDPRRRRVPAGHRRLAHARGHPGADRRDHGDGEDAHVPHHKLTARTPPGSAAVGDGPPSPATSSTWTRTSAPRARSSTAGSRPAARSTCHHASPDEHLQRHWVQDSAFEDSPRRAARIRR